MNVREYLRNQGWIFSAGENEGTVWRQAKKCLSEAAARAGNHPQPATTLSAVLDTGGEHPRYVVQQTSR